MDKDEFVKLLPTLQKRLGSVEKIVVGAIGGPYSKGCFFEEGEKKWKVYECDEKKCRIRLNTTDELEAFEKLYSLVIFRIETLERL